MLTGLIPVPRSLDDFLLIQDDEVFLEQAYQVLLGRPADATGAQYYGGKLRDGYGRTAVVKPVVVLSNNAIDWSVPASIGAFV